MTKVIYKVCLLLVHISIISADNNHSTESTNLVVTIPTTNSNLTHDVENHQVEKPTLKPTLDSTSIVHVDTAIDEKENTLNNEHREVSIEDHNDNNLKNEHNKEMNANDGHGNSEEETIITDGNTVTDRLLKPDSEHNLHHKTDEHKTKQKSDDVNLKYDKNDPEERMDGKNSDSNNGKSLNQVHESDEDDSDNGMEDSDDEKDVTKLHLELKKEQNQNNTDSAAEIIKGQENHTNFTASFLEFILALCIIAGIYIGAAKCGLVKNSRFSRKNYATLQEDNETTVLSEMRYDQEEELRAF